MTTKELILQELEQLPEILLEAVLDFLLFLKPKYIESSENNPWMQFAGILNNEAAQEIQKLVYQEFEQVDVNEW